MADVQTSNDRERRSLPLDEQIQLALSDAGFDETDVENATAAVMPLVRRALRVRSSSVTFYRDQPPVWWGR